MPVECSIETRQIGSEHFYAVDREVMLNAGTAWHLSAVRQNLPVYESHLVRLLRHTRLDRIHWINFDQRIVTLKTLNK